MKIKIVKNKPEEMNEIFGAIGDLGKAVGSAFGKKFDPAQKNALTTSILQKDKKMSVAFKKAMGSAAGSPLYDLQRDAENAFGFGANGGKGNFSAGLNLFTTHYQTAVAASNRTPPTVDSDSVNLFIEGLKEMLNFYKQNVLSGLSEDKKLKEAFGMKNKDIDNLIAQMQPVAPNGLTPQQADAALAGKPPAATPGGADGAGGGGAGGAGGTGPAGTNTTPKTVPVFKATPESGGDVLYARLKALFKGVQGGEETLKQYLKMISNQLRANNIKLMEQGTNLSPSRAAGSAKLAAQLSGFRSKTATGMKQGVSGPVAPGIAGTAANIQKGSVDLFGPAVLLLKQSGMDQKSAVVLATQIKNITAKHLKKYGVDLPQKTSRVNVPPEKKAAKPPPPPSDADEKASYGKSDDNDGVEPIEDLKKFSELGKDRGQFMDQLKSIPEFPKNEISTTTLLFNVLNSLAKQLNMPNGEALLAEGVDYKLISKRVTSGPFSGSLSPRAIEKLLAFLVDEKLFNEKTIEALKSIDSDDHVASKTVDESKYLESMRKLAGIVKQ